MASTMNTATWFNANSMVLVKAFINNAKKIPPSYPRVIKKEDGIDTSRSFFSILPLVELGNLQVKIQGSTSQIDQLTEGTPATFEYLTYALEYIITKEARMEDAMRLAAKLPPMLSYSEQTTKDVIAWQLYNLAFTLNGPDGVPLVSTMHPLSQAAGGGTWSNSGGASALTPDNFTNGLINFQTMVSDRGQPAARTPRYLVVGPTQWKTGEEIINSRFEPYTDENQINANQGAVELIVSRWITSDTAWYMTSAPGGIDSIEGDTASLFMDFHWENDQKTYIEDRTDNFHHRTEFRATTGWGNPRGFYASMG